MTIANDLRVGMARIETKQDQIFDELSRGRVEFSEIDKRIDELESAQDIRLDAIEKEIAGAKASGKAVALVFGGLFTMIGFAMAQIPWAHFIFHTKG